MQNSCLLFFHAEFMFIVFFSYRIHVYFFYAEFMFTVFFIQNSCLLLLFFMHNSCLLLFFMHNSCLLFFFFHTEFMFIVFFFHTEFMSIVFFFSYRIHVLFFLCRIHGDDDWIKSSQQPTSVKHVKC